MDSAFGSSSWLICFQCLEGIIPFISWKGKKTFPPCSLLWKNSMGMISGIPLLPQCPSAAITQLSTIHWNNRLFILNLTSNTIMVSFYIYTVLFIPEDPQMFQLLMGSSCLIVDSMTAQQCRAEAELCIQQKLQGEFRQVKQNYPNCNLAKTPGASISLLTKCCP